jgi:hypothetical protein
LLTKYGGSPAKVVSSIYSEHNWEDQKFNKSLGYWENIQNQRSFLDNIGKELGLKDIKDWYHVTQSQIKAKGGSRLLNLYRGSSAALLKSVYNNLKWKGFKFSKKNTIKLSL